MERREKTGFENKKNINVIKMRGELKYLTATHYLEHKEFFGYLDNKMFEHIFSPKD